MNTMMTFTSVEGLAAGQVWVFAVCDSGRMDFVRAFTTEAVADDYVKRWLAEQFGYSLTGDATKDWCALDTRCTHDKDLSWLIVCEPVIDSATTPAPPAVDLDSALFDQIVAVGASIWVSNTVDHLEMEVRNPDLAFKMDQQALLRAVLLTVQQRLDEGYGVLAAAQPNVCDASRTSSVQWNSTETQPASDRNTTEHAFDEELEAALSAAVIAVEIEAENLVDLDPNLDTVRAVQMIVKRLQTKGFTI